MVRDYAKKNKALKKPPPNQSPPQWAWFFSGALIGIFCSFLFYLVWLGKTNNNLANHETITNEADANNGETEKRKNDPEFMFYTLLPNSEVIVTNTKSENDPAETAEYIYYLQAGSFRSKKDADALRANLLLLNLNASIKTATLKNNQTWHRVQVGPYESQSKLSKAKDILAEQAISSLLLKEKKS